MPFWGIRSAVGTGFFTVENAEKIILTLTLSQRTGRGKKRGLKTGFVYGDAVGFEGVDLNDLGGFGILYDIAVADGFFTFVG